MQEKVIPDFFELFRFVVLVALGTGAAAGGLASGYQLAIWTDGPRGALALAGLAAGIAGFIGWLT